VHPLFSLHQIIVKHTKKAFMLTKTTHQCAMIFCTRGLLLLPLHYPAPDQERRTCSCGRPDCSSPGKHPVWHLVPNGLKNATADPKVIVGWFQGQPWNLGIATGSRSGIVALDIDPRHDGDGSLAALEAEHGPIPETWRFKTGGNGEHIIFRHPGGVIRNSVSAVAPGIDVRGERGYIVAPPSRHASGGLYLIAENSHDEIADAPRWLLSRVLSVPGGEQPTECVTDALPAAGYAEDQARRIRSAMAFIPAGNRDIWLRVGMALHSTGWGLSARTIWDEWSRASPKFNSVDQDRTWRSFGRSCRPGSLVTLGTLFALAKQHGWHPGSCRKLIARYAGLLLVRGIGPYACLDLIVEFRDRHGGLNATDEEIAETVAFVFSRELRKRGRQDGSVGGRNG
jgi:Bifunctional DNA primase/polymerase, N-terminal/Primase C terminal 2 (PriCT-2)